MADKPLLSIVCPAYQEEEVLPLFHRELMRVLESLENAFRLEILYVDDGSKDRTLLVLRRLADDDHRVQYLSLSRNFGHQAALTAGLEHVRGDVVISLDVDLQHPPAVIPQLLTRWRAGFDIVLTIRQEDPNLSFFKRWTSKTFYRVMQIFSQTEVRMAASDFRLMSRQALDALLRLRERHRFLRGMVHWLGFPTAEVPFMPAPRRAGTSKYTLKKMMRLAWDGLFSFTRLPLRIITYTGAALVLAGIVQGLWGLGSWILGQGVSGSWLYLLVSLYVIGGLVLGGLGVVGEYVGRIYEQVQGRPIYLVKEDSKTSSSFERGNGYFYPLEQVTNQ